MDLKLTIFMAAVVLATATTVWFLRPVAMENTAPVSGIVIRVLDGHTIRLLDRRVVRLAHIQAPALDQPGGQAAARGLDALLLDRRVVLVNPQPDGDGAITATVLIDGDHDAGLLMLKAGYAWHRNFQRQSLPDRELYGFLEAEARNDRRGLWRDRRPVPPWEWPPLSCGETQRPDSIVIEPMPV